MAIVDEQGRLFGRLNLLDAVLLVFLAGLVPLGYAAWALFRDQPPRLVSVTPNRAAYEPELRITVKGENLRPYMRVSAGTQQARDFEFKDTTEADVPFANLPPGEYDVVLYDQAQERFRLPRALTVTPSELPATEIVAVGAFGNLDAAGAAKLGVGLQLPGIGEVVAVGTPAPDLTRVFASSALVGVPIPNALQLPAVVRFRCYVRTQSGRPTCAVGDAEIASNVLVALPTPLGDTPFQVASVRGPQPLQQVPVQVRFDGHPAMLSLIATGDRDLGGTTNPLAAGATVTGIGGIRRLTESAGEVDVRLTADLQFIDGNWIYEALPLRVGSAFSLRTPRYEVRGTVTAVPPPSPPAQAP